MADNISTGQQELSVSQQRHRFIAECGEGGEPAEDADNEERPGFARDDTSMIGQLREESDRRAPHDIDRERAEWELKPLAELLHVSAHEVAKN